MNQVEISVSRRETGKQIAKRYRKEGKVPGIFYSKGKTTPILANPLDLRPVVYTSKSKIINLTIEGKSDMVECVLKDITFDPISDKITHFDLLGITRGELFTIDVPVILVGTAIGEKEGGLVQHTMHRVSISCMPRHLPNSIVVDVTNLGVNKSIYIKDIKMESITFNVPDDSVVVSIVPPRVSKLSAAEEAEEMTLDSEIESEE